MAADGLVNRGNTYKEIGRVNEAIQDYVHAIAVRPTMAEAHANLASAYKDRYVIMRSFRSFGTYFWWIRMLHAQFECASITSIGYL